ncbi:unnamed protein product [marine sediment metagenome]|uniref:Uncharacterized protein n=1 Tax=marine sediment metagenome TaxID=412755 RepID=X0ZYZ3_9ZZZZ
MNSDEDNNNSFDAHVSDPNWMTAENVQDGEIGCLQKRGGAMVNMHVHKVTGGIGGMVTNSMTQTVTAADGTKTTTIFK